MKRACFICLFLCVTSTFLWSQSNPVPLVNQTSGVVSPSVFPSIGASQTEPKAQRRILDSYGMLPLSFEANRGQTDARVKFLSRTGGYSLFLTTDEAVMAAPKARGVLRMKLRNANPAARVTGEDELAGTSNYFIGNDPSKWRTNVPTYAKVKYQGIYSGIDLVYYGNQRQLEYDFIVAPGADPRRIQFEVRGAKRIRQNAHGDLLLKMDDGEILWRKPVAYQEKDGTRQEIAAHYATTNTNQLQFELAKYDAGRPLYIDPLIYSTYLGGSGFDEGLGIAVDSAGSAYVTGATASTDFPVTPGAFQTVCGGTCSGNAFVTKLNPTGSALVYSTYLGGSGGAQASGIAVDASGSAYVTGGTQSTDFPVTPGAFQTVCGGTCSGNAFVTKLNPTGSALVYSTYLGGSGGYSGDSGFSIAVDNAGNTYVTGQTDSTDFPVTPGAFQTTGGGGDAFITKFNPTGSALVYSTYLGGSSGYDGGDGITVDSAGNAYVTGWTDSTDFPTTPGAFQTVCGGVCLITFTGFVSKLNPTGSALGYSTYLGGSDTSRPLGIAVDNAGNTYVTGQTVSTDFPVTPGAFQTTFSGGGDAFITKFNPTGSALVYSTYLGGSWGARASGIAVDASGSAYVTGWTDSTDFPTTPGAFQTVCNHGKNCAKYGDAFVTKLNPGASALVYSTYLGGRYLDQGNSAAVDSAGNAYITGCTSSTNFPTENPFQPKYAGSNSNPRSCGDAFVAKIQLQAATTTTLTSSPNPSEYGEAVTFTAVVAPAPPDGETVSFMKGKTVLGTGTLSGGSSNFTTSALPVGKNSITAVYGGDLDFGGSTSKPVKQVVEKAD